MFNFSIYCLLVRLEVAAEDALCGAGDLGVGGLPGLALREREGEDVWGVCLLAVGLI